MWDWYKLWSMGQWPTPQLTARTFGREMETAPFLLANNAHRHRHKNVMLQWMAPGKLVLGKKNLYELWTLFFLNRWHYWIMGVGYNTIFENLRLPNLQLAKQLDPFILILVLLFFLTLLLLFLPLYLLLIGCVPLDLPVIRPTGR